MNDQIPPVPPRRSDAGDGWHAGQRVLLHHGSFVGLTGVLVQCRDRRRWLVSMESLERGCLLMVDAAALMPARKNSGRFLPDIARRMDMNVAKTGDCVRIECVSVPDPSADGRPAQCKRLEFIVGSGMVIPGISLGVVGMAVGDSKCLLLQPLDAFGPVRRQLIKKVPRKKFPQHLDLHPGKRLAAVDAAGHRRRVKIVQVKRHFVIVDANHPLAGKVLNVTIRLLALHQSHANRDKPRFDLGGEG